MLKLKLGKKKSEAPVGGDANLPAVSEAAPGAEGEDGAAEAPAKKKIPLLFIIIPAALVVLGGGGATAVTRLRPRKRRRAAVTAAARRARRPPARARWRPVLTA